MSEHVRGVLIDPESPCFDHMPGYLPVLGGIRHVTELDVEPAPNSWVKTVCGATIVVPRARHRRDDDQRWDCRWCALELLNLDPPPLWPRGEPESC